MAKVIVLGNCVAERLGLLLEGLFKEQARTCPGLRGDWQVEQATPVYNITEAEVAELAMKAAGCDCVFSQPLFNFGPCNTQALTKAVGPRLHLFSAPNFEAYFPDVFEIGPVCEKEKFPPPLEWHSRIIVQCKAASIPGEDIEKIYLNHSLFRKKSMHDAIERSFSVYEKRDRNVEIGSLEFVKNNYAREPLFYTFNHPGDALLKHLLTGMLQTIGMKRDDALRALNYIPWAEASPEGWAYWGFGFSAWPIITRHHDYFSFPGREWFRIEQKKLGIGAAALEWYRYYDAHPGIFAQALAASQK